MSVPVCGVCQYPLLYEDDPASKAENPPSIHLPCTLRCEDCGTRFHEACNAPGAHFRIDEADTCQYCRFRRKALAQGVSRVVTAKDVACNLCGRADVQGLALVGRPVGTGPWCHVSCALATPGITVDAPQGLKGVARALRALISTKQRPGEAVACFHCHGTEGVLLASTCPCPPFHGHPACYLAHQRRVFPKTIRDSESMERLLIASSSGVVAPILSCFDHAQEQLCVEPTTPDTCATPGLPVPAWMDWSEGLQTSDALSRTCGVCFRSVAEDETKKFVRCDGCNVVVHSTCYLEAGLKGKRGSSDDCFTDEEEEASALLSPLKKTSKSPVNEQDAGTPWYCRFCESPSRRGRLPNCALCFVRGGATIPIKDVPEAFVHVVCALYVPESIVDEPTNSVLAAGVDSALRKRGELQCAVCKLRDRACVQCSEPSCRNSHHAYCAARAGFALRRRETDLGYETLCRRHSLRLAQQPMKTIEANPIWLGSAPRWEDDEDPSARRKRLVAQSPARPASGASPHRKRPRVAEDVVVARADAPPLPERASTPSLMSLELIRKAVSQALAQSFPPQAAKLWTAPIPTRRFAGHGRTTTLAKSGEAAGSTKTWRRTTEENLRTIRDSVRDHVVSSDEARSELLPETLRSLYQDTVEQALGKLFQQLEKEVQDTDDRFLALSQRVQVRNARADGIELGGRTDEASYQAQRPDMEALARKRAELAELDAAATCGTCHGDESSFGNVIVICETCGVGAHQKCVEGLEVIPEGDWQCERCTKHLKKREHRARAKAAEAKKAENAQVDGESKGSDDDEDSSTSSSSTEDSDSSGSSSEEDSETSSSDEATEEDSDYD